MSVVVGTCEGRFRGWTSCEVVFAALAVGDRGCRSRARDGYVVMLCTFRP
jgi:hypothetical protein